MTPRFPLSVPCESPRVALRSLRSHGGGLTQPRPSTGRGSEVREGRELPEGTRSVGGVTDQNPGS